MKRVLFIKLVLFSLLVGIDALTKVLALHFVPSFHGFYYPFDGIALFEVSGGTSLSLNLVFNSGMAWGVFSGYPQILLIVRMSLFVCLMIFLWHKRDWRDFSFWLIAAGALGNILDSFIYGHVVDFIHVRLLGWSFPVFNVADSLITIGILLWLIFHRRLKEGAANVR